jgi:biopolymer transport protein ExbB
MKKLAVLLTLLAAVILTVPSTAIAQDDAAAEDTTAMAADTGMADSGMVAEEPAVEEEEAAAPAEEVVEEEESFTQILIKQFIDGGPGFMSLVLIALILGLAFVIERFISLTLASTNVKALMKRIEERLEQNDVEGAKDVCRSNRSPAASIIYQGLERVDDGIAAVEKSIEAYGSVQMGLLERGMVWIALFIALAPMLGFLGTVIGMIVAFDDIAKAGDISPSVVAGGIKVALLTTVFGLIVAIILQIFYNALVAKIDGMVNDMEDASIAFVDMLLRYKIIKD